MNLKLKNLIFHPNTFFKEITYEKKNLLIPFVFVAFAGFCDIALHCRTANECTPIYMFEMMALPVLTWALVTLVIFYFARYFSGISSLLKTFQNTGFGFIPLTLADLVKLLLVVALMLNPHLYTNGITLLPALLSVFLMIWSLYLWYCGIRNTHSISQIQAIVVIGAVILFLYAFWFIQFLSQFRGPEM